MSQNDHDPGPAKGRRGRRVAISLVVLTVAGAALGAIAVGVGQGEEADPASVPTAPVKRGPLTIAVTTSGTVHSSQAVTLRSQVEGSTTILWVADEGTHVEKGDLLVRLDASELEAELLEEQLEVQSAKASLVEAKQSLKVAESQAESDIEKAELELKLAKLDYMKYTGHEVPEELLAKGDLKLARLVELETTKYTAESGEYHKKISELKSKIDIAKAELKQAKFVYEGTKRLYEQGYVTKMELERDQLALQKAKRSVQVAKAELRLLKKYTHKRKLAELASAVEQKKAALKRAKLQAKADVIQAEARLTNAKISYQRQKEHLAEIKRQLKHTKIYAPIAGMVVYPSEGWRRRNNPISEGIKVREGEELIRLPTTSSMEVETQIHQAALDKVSVGMPVRITTEALPGQVLWGEVTNVSIMPDEEGSWLTEDRKVYPVTIAIKSDTQGLRPGMSVQTQIIVEQFNDTLYVPIQSVLRVDGKPTVYLPAPGDPQPRVVKTGLSNNRYVRVISGLQADQRVLLAPPLPPSTQSARVLKLAQMSGEKNAKKQDERLAAATKEKQASAKVSDAKEAPPADAEPKPAPKPQEQTDVAAEPVRKS